MMPPAPSPPPPAAGNLGVAVLSGWMRGGDVRLVFAVDVRVAPMSGFVPLVLQRPLPVLERIGRIGKHLHPGERVGESWPVRQTAADTRRQVRVQQPRTQPSNLLQAFEILLRDLEHAEPRALLMAVGGAGSGSSFEEAQRHEE